MIESAAQTLISHGVLGVLLVLVTGLYLQERKNHIANLQAANTVILQLQREIITAINKLSELAELISNKRDTRTNRRNTE